jgi:hypothetical protein
MIRRGRIPICPAVVRKMDVSRVEALEAPETGRGHIVRHEVQSMRKVEDPQDKNSTTGLLIL